MGTGGGALCGCVTAAPGLCGIPGGVLLWESVEFGGGMIFCVSIEGSEVFLSGGGGRDFSYLLQTRSDFRSGWTASESNSTHCININIMNEAVFF